MNAVPNATLIEIPLAPDEREVRDAYRALTLALIERGVTITTMESCTGGLIASLITDTEGASAVLKGAFVAYSNAAKTMLGVPGDVIGSRGVYSVETAVEMARACRRAFGAMIGVGVTGTMGNVDPANGDSVPGQVYIAVAHGDGLVCRRLRLGHMDSRLAGKLAVAAPVAALLMALPELRS